MGLPPRLLAAVAEIQNLDQATSDALGTAVVSSFGPCLCQQFVALGGHRVWVEMCAGHQFLCEDDRACTRIQHLLFARDRAAHWQKDEWGLAEWLNRGL